MNDSRTHLEMPRFDPPLHEPDIANEIAPVLQAMIIALAILLAILFAAAALQPVAEWTSVHLSLL